MTQFLNIPEELRQLSQWVNWRIEQRAGKPTKVPKQPSGVNADSTAPETWSTFERASQMNGKFDGIGFVFTKEAGDIGVDLDKCRDPKTGKTEKWALDIIKELDSYTELSQSGTGWHVIVKGISNWRYLVRQISGRCDRGRRCHAAQASYGDSRK